MTREKKISLIYCLIKLTVPVNFFLKEDTIIAGSVSFCGSSSEDWRAMLSFFIAFRSFAARRLFCCFALFIEGETVLFVVLLNKGIIPLINYNNIQKIKLNVKVKRIIFYDLFKYTGVCNILK